MKTDWNCIQRRILSYNSQLWYPQLLSRQGKTLRLLPIPSTSGTIPRGRALTEMWRTVPREKDSETGEERLHGSSNSIDILVGSLWNHCDRQRQGRNLIDMDAFLKLSSDIWNGVPRGSRNEIPIGHCSPPVVTTKKVHTGRTLPYS